MTQDNGLTESQEDYLEVILAILEDKQAVRAKDIAKRLGVTGPSVTGALRMLSAKGVVNYAPYDVITLTKKGTKAAKEVARRHRVLKDFLTRVLGVDASEADVAACRMEHVLSPSVMRKIVDFLGLVDMCPDGGNDWICSVLRTFEEVEDPEGCRQCIERCLEQHRGRGSDPEPPDRSSG